MLGTLQLLRLALQLENCITSPHDLVFQRRRLNILTLYEVRPICAPIFNVLVNDYLFVPHCICSCPGITYVTQHFLLGREVVLHHTMLVTKVLELYL